MYNFTYENNTELFDHVNLIQFQWYLILKHYVPIPVCIISILCIIITLMAVTQRGLWRTTVTYIVILAIVDLFTLIFTLILSMDYFMISIFSEEIYADIFFMMETILGELIDALLFLSNWITVLLATERYLAVCYPLKSRFIDHKYRRLSVFLLILFTIIVKLPGLIILKYLEYFTTINNLILVRKIYIWIVQVFLFFLCPFSILTYVNLCLIIAVRISKQMNIKNIINNNNISMKKNTIKNVNTNHRNFFKRNIIYLSSLFNIHVKLCCCLVYCKFVMKNKQNNSDKQKTYSHNPLLTNSNSLNQTINNNNNNNANNEFINPIDNNDLSEIQMERTHREEKKITITLVCLIITFFICQGPFVLINVITRFSVTWFQNFETNQTHNRYLHIHPHNHTIDGILINTNSNNVNSIIAYNDNITTDNHTINYNYTIQSDYFMNHISPVLNYISPFSVIALALKSDLSLFFYCWFCDRFVYALKRIFFKCKIIKIICIYCFGQNFRHNYHFHQHHCHHQKIQPHYIVHKCDRNNYCDCGRSKCQSKHSYKNKSDKIVNSKQVYLELQVPTSNSLPNYKLPHHHYKNHHNNYNYPFLTRSRYYNSTFSKYSYCKPPPLPINLNKHKKTSLHLVNSTNLYWSSSSGCSDKSFKNSSSPKNILNI